MNVLLLACLCLLPLSVTTTDGGPEVIKVEQDSDVVLPCSLSNQQDITAAVFDWKKVIQKDQPQKEVFFYNAGTHYNNGKDGQSEQFRGRVSHFEDQLKHGNASIIIRNTKMADSGNYTCAFPLLQPPQTFYIELVVDPVLKDRSAENIPGAAPKPSVTSLKQTKDWSLLQCEAHGNPQPAVEWQDSDGNTLPAEEPTFSERGGSFYVTVDITVNKTDDYRCVATQKTINHQIHANISVYISGAAQEPNVRSLKVTKDWVLLQCLVRGASPELKLEWEDSSGNRLLAHEPSFSERGGSYDVTLNITVTQTDLYRCVSTDKTNKHTQDIQVDIGGSSTGWIGIVVAVLVTLLVVGILVGVLLAVLIHKGCITSKCSNKNPAGSHEQAEGKKPEQSAENDSFIST